MREPIRDKGRLEHIVDAIDNIFSFANEKTIDELDADIVEITGLSAEEISELM